MNRNIYTKRILLLLVPTSWLKIVKTLPRFFPSLFLLLSYTSYRFFLVFVSYFSVLNVYYCFCFQRSFKDQARCQRKKHQCWRRSTQESMTRGSCLRWSRCIYSPTNSWRSFWLSFEYFCTFREDTDSSLRNHYTLSCDNDSNSDNGYSF